MTAGRAWGRVAVVVAAVLAITVSAAAVPAVLGGQTAPARSLVQVNPAGSGVASSLSGAGLGALSAADAASVGGRVGPGESPLRSRSSAVHFVVRSSEPAYWRTGAYGQYTGQGWERSGRSASFDGRFADEGLRGERISYQVTLKRAATALPTAWRPASVNVSEGLRVQPGTTLTAADGVAAGTSYRGVSYSTARDPAVLRTAGREYPAAIRERYLGLPDAAGTRRLARFTTNLTSDAESPYQTAVQIERWLEANKEYSLNASHDPSEGTVASQFVFEMERGYCEYYATAMVVMLRSQGIPARYVVGYSTGQQTGPNEYTVRGMNAHAWVEVYFPDVGWVRFDPTPGSERLATEQAAFVNQTGADPRSYTPTETGSPGESFSANASDAVTGQDAGGTPNGSVNGTLPGNRTVSGTETVVRNGTPTGTPPRGTPDGTVTPPTGETPAGTAAGTANGTSDGTPSGGTSGGGTTDGTPAGGSTEDGTPSDAGTPAGTDEGTTDTTPTGTPTGGGNGTDGGETSGGNGTDDDRTRQLGGGLTVSLNRTAVPGATVRVTVTRNGEPVVGATVLFNGRTVGETGRNGSVVARVPYTETLSVSVLTDRDRTVEPRFEGWGAVPPPDGAAGLQAGNNTTYELDTRANVSVVGSRRANGTVTVVAGVADVPLRNATVRVDGRVVGRTDARGRFELRLPGGPGEYTITVRRGAVAGNRTITVPALSVSRSVEWPLALPFAPVTVTATLNGTGDSERVANGSVAVNGRRVGGLGSDGTATTRLPLAPRAEIVVRAAGQRATTTVGGVYANAAAVVGAAVALLVGGVGVARRRGVAARELPGLVARLAGRVGRWAVGAAVTVAAVLDRGLRAVWAAVREAVADRDPVGFARRLVALARAGGLAVHAWLAALVGESLAEGAGGPRDATSAAGTGEATAARERVRTAWRAFVAALSVRRARRRTPGEIARWAVERDGLAAEPVARLRDAYRAVEYGGRDPERYVTAVREAVRALLGGDEE